MSSRLKLPVPFQLAAVWSPSLNRSFSGWLVSEKLDGVRAMWDGRGHLLSRNGLCFKCPPEFTEGFPRGTVLDGELWIDRSMFVDTVTVLRSRESNWMSLVSFKVFDVHNSYVKKLPFADRLRWLSDNISPDCRASVVVHHTLPHTDSLSDLIQDEMRKITNLNGEGLILRDPDALYTPGRKSPSLSPFLKVKPYMDDEAVVMGSTFDAVSRKGSITVRDSGGRVFKIGSGLTGDVPMGSVVTFRYNSRHTDSGIPRFASFLRVRLDDPFSRSDE